MNTKKTLDTVAKIISQLSQPPLVIGIFIIFLVFYYAPDTVTSIEWFAIAAGLIGVLPTAFTFLAVKMGWIKDVLLTRRQDRSGPLLVGALGTIITFIVFYKIGVPLEILVFLMALVLVLILVLIITLFWKISVHAATITVITVSSTILADGKYWYLLLLIPLVMWSRVERKRHTLAQVIAGALVNGLIVYITFDIFGLV